MSVVVQPSVPCTIRSSKLNAPSGSPWATT